MTLFAGLRGPLYAWELTIGPTDGVSFVGTKTMTVTVIRPDDSTTTWTSSDGGITFPVATATTLVARHVYASDGSDIPFIARNGNEKTCHYKFVVSLTVDGAAVAVPTICAQLRNLEAC